MSVGHGINKPEVERDLQKLSGLIHDGGLPSVTDAELTRLLHTLCIAHTGDTTNALHIVQGLVVNHEVLMRHITKLNTANGRTQKWFMVMAALSLIGLGVQIYRDLTTESVVAVSPADGDPRITHDTQQHAAPGNVKSDGTVSKPIPPPANE